MKKFLSFERDPLRLTYATCLGIGIGLSPFLGLQTWLAIGLARLCGLSIPLTFSVLYLVNNPFITTIPIAIANYVTGYLFFTYVLPLDLCGSNPAWFSWIERKIAPTLYTYTGLKQVCFWYFIGGGIIFAILVTAALYPFIKYFYINLVKKYENSSSK